MILDKTLILNKIRKHYSFEKKVDFARFLDIAPQTLNSWYERNTFDIELLYSKCVGIDANFLLSGEGELMKKITGDNENEEDFELIKQKNSNLIKEIDAIKETNDLLRFKIGVLEKDLSEVTNTQHKTFISKSVDDAEPKLKKENSDAKK